LQYKLHTVKAERTDCILFFHPKSQSADRFGHMKLRKENYLTGSLVSWDFKRKRGLYFKAKPTL
jgi:hypothetical protein